MVDPISERASDHCTVRVYPSRPLSMACDPLDRHFAMAGDGVFGVDRPEGITAQRVAEIANFLHDHR